MSNESRAKFEKWYENDHSGGIDSLSSDWDEERHCYKNHANHLAWKAYDSRQSEIDSLRAENERLKRVSDGLDCLIAAMNHDGHDHLTLDYLLKVTGKSAT